MYICGCEYIYKLEVDEVWVRSFYVYGFLGSELLVLSHQRYVWTSYDHVGGDGTHIVNLSRDRHTVLLFKKMYLSDFNK